MFNRYGRTLVAAWTATGLLASGLALAGDSVPGVWKTGQTKSYADGDDGQIMKGAAWPTPRFTVLADTNCIRDNLTGLVWARNANLDGIKDWLDAVAFCRELTYGGTNDWRLPNLRELQSLVDYGRHSPALCDTTGAGPWKEGDPFINALKGGYWTSTTYAEDGRDYAWSVSLNLGAVFYELKSEKFNVWPVRGGSL